MNRRNFIKNLGLAVAGAAIAKEIKLIEAVIPVEAEAQTLGTYLATPIDFASLEKAYRRACVGSCEPNLILMRLDNYIALKEYIKPQLRFSDVNYHELGFENFKFRNAITTYGELEIQQHPMLVDLRFKRDEEIPVLFGVRKDYISVTPHYQNFYRDLV